MHRSGFTLIEVLVTVAIIALVIGAVVPRFGRGQPLERRMAFVAELNALLGFGWQQALTSNTIHRVTFDFGKQQVSLQADEGAGSAGKKGFQEIKNADVVSTVHLPNTYEIKQFFIEDYDEMQRLSGRGGKDIQFVAYFCIVPEGLVQAVIINAIDKSDLDEQGRAVRFSLVMNPFSGQWTYHDSFQKP